MLAYDSIFYAIPYYICILAGIALLSLLIQKHALLARSIIFMFQFWVAPLFYFTYMAVAHRVTPIAVMAGCLELFFLAIYLILFHRLFAVITKVSPEFHAQMLRYLKIGTCALALISAYIYLQPGAGITSTGSRIEFLADSKLNLYLDEITALIQLAAIPVVAAIINNEKRWSKFVVLYITLISAISILSGSKGSILLSILSIMSLLKFDSARDYVRVLWAPICIAVVLFSVTVLVVGQFLSLEPSQMVFMMYDRLFLANDARALAIDWSNYLRGNSTSLFSEAFRNIATLFGSAPKHIPLGQYLYTLEFGTNGLQGGNTSSTALLVAYGRSLEKILFTVLIAIGAVLTGLLTEVRGRGAVLRLGVGIYLLSLLSQDLLAFELFINVIVSLLTAGLAYKILSKLLVHASGAAELDPIHHGN